MSVLVLSRVLVSATAVLIRLNCYVVQGITLTYMQLFYSISVVVLFLFNSVDNYIQ